MSTILRLFFRLFGYKIVGEVPSSLKKAIFAVAPHWRNSDFFVGLGTRATLNRRIGYLGKAELFKPPFGFIFRALGGIPVNRTENKKLVESQVVAVKAAPEGLISLAPEGTRKDVQKLRTGFYYIAVGAEIPIIMVGFDTVAKQVVLAEPFYPTGNFEADMLNYFVPFFEKIGGKKKKWIQNYKDNKFN